MLMKLSLELLVLACSVYVAIYGNLGFVPLKAFHVAATIFFGYMTYTSIQSLRKKPDGHSV